MQKIKKSEGKNIMKVSRSRLLATAVVLMTFVSLFSLISPAEQAFVDVEEYSDQTTRYPPSPKVAMEGCSAQQVGALVTSNSGPCAVVSAL